MAASRCHALGRPAGGVYSAAFGSQPLSGGRARDAAGAEGRGFHHRTVSAGFTLNTDSIMAEFGLDYRLTNELTTVDGVLSGGALTTCRKAARRPLLAA